MNTALSWIKAYVPELECGDQEYTDAMTLSGTKVETFERLDKNLDKIYVGQILSIERHPDADKLIICQVDLGDKHLQIVGYTQELQKTSEEIFELMKLLLMDSVVKSTTPKK